MPDWDLVCGTVEDTGSDPDYDTQQSPSDMMEVTPAFGYSVSKKDTMKFNESERLAEQIVNNPRKHTWEGAQVADMHLKAVRLLRDFMMSDGRLRKDLKDEPEGE